MKRKFYLLALICAVAGTGVISSCKDTDEDLYNDLKNQLAQSDKNYNELKGLIAELKSGILNGKDGKDGVNGKDGVDGKSAYEIWLEQGNTGTEADFIASLKGEPGKDASIDDLLEAMKVYETKEEHQADKEYLEGLIEALKKDIANLAILDAASINIQTVYNPAFGYLTTPFGVNSNVLLSYYSTETQSQNLFPASASELEDGLTPAEFMALGIVPANFDLTENKINMGKLYLTVNPANIDYSGKSLLLVDSKGEESGVSLSPLEKCDEQLAFGYTRANNYLYSSNVTVSDLGSAEKYGFDEETVKAKKDQVKAALKGSGTNGSTIVKLAYELFNDMVVRKAVQLNDVKTPVTSDYNLAAFLLKPFGFEAIQKACDSKIAARAKDAVISLAKKAGNGKFSMVRDALYSLGSEITSLPARTLPALLAEDTEGIRFISAEPTDPTWIDSSVKLHAVSFNAEMIVPFALKHVAVTKVIADEGIDAAQAAKDANNCIHMNCVINNPQDLVIDLAELVPGAEYEVAYSAMDYYGQTEVVRYYFIVK